MLVDEGLEILGEGEAIDLLRTSDVGRVGVTIGCLPAIFPVNFSWIDGAIVFRTAPGTKRTAALTNSIVAFEVDDYRAADRSGWSVLVVGQATLVHDLDMTLKVIAAELEPYAEGARTAIVRIEPEFVSGRRVIHGEPAAVTT